MSLDPGESTPVVRILRLPHAAELPLPAQASADAAGFDLRAALEKPLRLEPRARIAVPTGLALALPRGWEAQVRPRSGLARRHGVTVLNAPGTIDADYRGEIHVLLVHHGDEALTIEHGDRIAQLVVARVAEVEWREVDSLDTTERGGGGFGSSGRR
ncbi:MAG: dUTP diphosphatase [Acidobacteriota bacterium]